MFMIEDSELQRLVDEAAEKIKYWNWDSFSLATLMPKEWLTEEEKDWDKKLDDKSQSIKNRFNGKLLKMLLSATGKRYDAIYADGKVTFDLAAKTVKAEYEPRFVFGRYKKLQPGLSQSRWVCTKCEGEGCFKCDWKGKYYTSVEELIGDEFKMACGAGDYALHASGREDVDVINIAGRPFVMEIKRPGKHQLDLEAIRDKINADKQVEVSHLRVVPRAFVEAVTESHFEKEYEALVEFSEPLTEEMLKKLENFTGMTIAQRTPKRVAHRRADLVRNRKIVALTFLGAEGNHGRFRIMAEAGTYIKELISGDNGRTPDSFAGVTGTVAKCVELKVVKIYDEFLDMLLDI
jgi:tRNA pseudouridine synthase 10